MDWRLRLPLRNVFVPTCCKTSLVSSEPTHRALQASIVTLPSAKIHSCKRGQKTRNISGILVSTINSNREAAERCQHKERQLSPMFANELVRTVIVESLAMLAWHAFPEVAFPITWSETTGRVPVIVLRHTQRSGQVTAKRS